MVAESFGHDGYSKDKLRCVWLSYKRGPINLWIESDVVESCGQPCCVRSRRTRSFNFLGL